jgi:F0F1-type ATP synthase membrane subunit b/b'
MSYENQLGWIVTQIKLCNEAIADAKSLLEHAERNLAHAEVNLKNLREQMEQGNGGA